MDENDRLRDLLSAAQTIVEESDLEVVLRRIVEVAVRLVDAEYGALGVLTPEGDALEQFVFVGIDQRGADRIGALPTGHGLLGQLIVDPRPIRLDRVADHPSAEGFPAHHPPMDSFLGVPVRVRGEVFGNLYLTNRRSGSFTDEDERLVEALAVSAGTALEKARLLQHSRTRERSMAAAAELSAALLASPTDTVFDLIAGRLFDLADVDRVVLALIDDERASARIVATRGLSEAELRGAVISASSRAMEAVFAGEACALGRQPGADDDPIRISEDGVAGAILVAPLRSRAQLWGAVILARSPRRPRFTEAEVDGIVDFASRASIAWELARAREDQQREDLADDRLRIARDLHDHVIQQLFGTGLLLQAVGSTLPAGSDADAVLDAVARLDDAISQIRTVIFALSRSDGESLRHRILDVVAEESSHRRRPPTLRFVGPVDHAIVGALADDVVAVVRELLSNAVRHADAESIAVDVIATPDTASVIVADDGRGIPAGVVRRGLQNLTDRAESRGGALEVDSAPGRTTVTFRVPLPGGER